MKFTTDFPISKHNQPIDYDSSVLMLGSCFSQNIGDKFQYYGFDTVVNPFGVIFNPHSLWVLMEKSVSGNFTENDVCGNFSYLAHSQLDGNDSATTLLNLKTAGIWMKNQIELSSHIIVTLGTAWIYELKATGEIVANCHQQPQALFEKRLLSIEKIQEALEKMERLIKKVNPTAQIIYTLSPVRHTKDGMIENTRSKARLYEAIQQRCEKGENYYFPAYELLMDDLRDYRFYAADMLHPNATAVDYVWNRFRESVLHTNTLTTIKAVEKHRKLQDHRPKNNEAHKEQLIKSSILLQQKFPNLKLQ
ncbi:GSCFA domain-containing protein [Nonlabens antarcticus]|uniref:GSCFA domain-containing protein n=1 Tax=Nonlabens antarcticus TaxID=392714 RepID=UPI0018916E8F|nr:GSCFA domain-containing protein [Nonlabens antarcticus]